MAGKKASDDFLTLFFDGNHVADSPSNTWVSDAYPFTGTPHTWVGFDENGTGFQPGDYAHVAIYNVAPNFAGAHYSAAGYTGPPAFALQGAGY